MHPTTIASSNAAQMRLDYRRSLIFKIRAEQFTTVMIEIECNDFAHLPQQISNGIDVRSNKIVKLSR